MVLQKIPTDFLTSLSSKKPIYITDMKMDLVTGVAKPNLVVIAPLNANIDFTTLTRITDISTATADMKLIPIPSNFMKSFNWRDHHRPEQSSDINKLITKVGNQYSCGCCWAFSTSNAISDVFVISGKLDYNPECSVTSILSCYPHCTIPSDLSTCTGRVNNRQEYSNQCGGGNIAPLANWIVKNGISDNKCIDFSWCEKNSACVNGSSKNLNYLIPDCPKNCNKKYFIDNVKSTGILLEEMTTEKLQNQVQFTKQWIYNYGTIVAGFLVFENLMKGKFVSELNPGGIYLEDVDYDNNKLFDYNTINKIAGGHAVCVIGWGEDKVHYSFISNKDLSKNRDEKGMVNVPYWIVRNSWSENWGMTGYFHMAMYPFNTQSQFDAVLQNNLGGCVLFTPKIKEPFIYSPSPSPSPSPSSSKKYLFLLIIIILLFVILILQLFV
jgi:C1A family cysteine protease